MPPTAPANAASVTTCYAGQANEYHIYVGQGLLSQVAPSVMATVGAERYVLLTDTNLHELHGERLVASFLAEGVELLVKVLTPGEVTKNRATKEEVEDWMLEHGCLRNTCVLALGGGVVGDFAGFVAATFMRGVPVVQIPASLLAMIDSSVGGKTGLDVPAGKNLIGAFHQPKAVYIDLDLLKTLPKRELVNGMGELIKYGAFWDEDLFSFLENSVDLILAKDGAAMQRIVQRSVEIKAHVVTLDEREGGLRAILNFGHTVGHGIEAVMMPTMLHGECVAIGMVKEAEIARALGHCAPPTVGRLIRCLKSYGLPVRVPERCVGDMEAVMKKMSVDKKNTRGQIKVVLLTGIGSVVEAPIARAVDPTLIRRVLSPLVMLRPPAAAAAGAADGVKGLCVEGEVRPPGSKSISNRILMLAGVAEGTCRVKGLLHSDDTQVMMGALQQLGASFEWEDNGDTLVVHGTGGAFRTPTQPLYLSNAGTAARFLTTLVTLVGTTEESRRSGAAAGIAGEGKEGGKAPPQTVLEGSVRMNVRPQGPLVEGLRAHGHAIDYLGAEGHLPLKVTGGGFKGGKLHLEGKVSSQFVSSVLLSGPMAVGEPLEVILAEENPTSAGYIDMTISVMKQFGIEVQQFGTNRFVVPQGVYRNPEQYVVESDASSSTYALAMAAVTGGTVTVQGVGTSSLQGDANFGGLMKQMGCTLEQSEDSTTVRGPPVGSSQLVGVDVDMADMTDAFMTAVAVAAAAKGTTRISGIANQHVKECDRIAAMCEGLALCGVVARNNPDGIEIDGVGGLEGGVGALAEAAAAAVEKVKGGAYIDCYDDHRIAMSFAVLGCACAAMGYDGPMGAAPVITDKECTDKTYPEFWDHMESELGVPLTSAPKVEAGAGVGGGGGSGGGARSRGFGDATMVIVGMRGAGKTTMGRAAAEAFGWGHVDVDDALMERNGGKTCKEIIAEQDWEGFRSEELAALEASLAACPERTIISCGGGIIETEAARAALVAWGGPVIHLERNIEDVVEYLDSLDTAGAAGEARPQYAGGATVRDKWASREPLYVEVSDVHFVTRRGDKEWENIAGDFIRVLDVVRGRALANPADPADAANGAEEEKEGPVSGSKKQATIGHGCTFLTMTFEDFSTVLPVAADSPAEAEVKRATFADMCEPHDALEFRVDLLMEPTATFIADQLALLRRHTALPIVYTVRSDTQGGTFPADQEDFMFALLRVGIEAGCEYIDVETCWDEAGRAAIIAQATQMGCRVISSMHAMDHPIAAFPDAEVAAWFRSCIEGGLAGKVDIVKVVGKAGTIECSWRLLAIARQLLDNDPKFRRFGDGGMIAMCSGPLGALSRALCLDLGPVPVTHPAVGGDKLAALGQLTAAQVHTLRGMVGASSLEGGSGEAKGDGKKHARGAVLRSAHAARAGVSGAGGSFYCLFGSPIGASPSPTMHNTAFAALGLDATHAYHLAEDPTTELMEATLKRADFGGASVTIPHKEAIVPLMTELSLAAKAIGAVNTVTRKPHMEGVLRGDNTDWIGIRNTLLKKGLKPGHNQTAEGQGGGDGANGGDSGDVPIVLVIGAGGTARAACYCAGQLGTRVVIYNRTFEKAEALAKQFNGEALRSLEVDGDLPGPVAAIISTIPGSANFVVPAHVLASKPVVLDASYKPRVTKLLAQAREAGCETIEGVEMLIEQGLAQSKIWTGKVAQPQVVADAVMAFYESS